jgi:hypothetical protein
MWVSTRIVTSRMFWDLSLKSVERVHTAQMARARQLRSYSRDCFAPSQESTGEHHAYDLVYLQSVDLGKFATTAWSISPSLWVPVLQLNITRLLKACLQPNTSTHQGIPLTMPDETRYCWRHTLQGMTKVPCAKEFHRYSWHRSPTANHDQFYQSTGGGVKSITIQVSCT